MGCVRIRDTEPSLLYFHLRLLNITECPYYLQREMVKPDQIKVPGDEEPQICAGYLEGVKDTCQVCNPLNMCFLVLSYLLWKRDSGGLLMAREGDQTVILGTVSFGDGCGVARKPGVYLAIGPHLDWIESVIGEKLSTAD